MENLFSIEYRKRGLLSALNTDTQLMSHLLRMKVILKNSPPLTSIKGRIITGISLKKTEIDLPLNCFSNSVVMMNPPKTCPPICCIYYHEILFICFDRFSSSELFEANFFSARPPFVIDGNFDFLVPIMAAYFT